jgi:hypothetical protein
VQMNVQRSPSPSSFSPSAFGLAISRPVVKDVSGGQSRDRFEAINPCVQVPEVSNATVTMSHAHWTLHVEKNLCKSLMPAWGLEMKDLIAGLSSAPSM